VRQAFVQSWRKNLHPQHWHEAGVSGTISVFACGSGSWIAMRAKLWFISFALCVAGTSAAATSLCAQDQDNSSRAAAESSNPHDAGNTNTNGDALGLNRDGTARSSSSDSSSSTSGSSSDHSGGATPAPPPATGHLPRLGWQSLLPGSIQ
jgi:hypothetical protein